MSSPSLDAQLARFDQYARGEIPRLVGWTTQLCRAVALRQVQPVPASEADPKVLGEWVERVGATLRREPTAPWTRALENGLQAVGYPRRWFGLARDVVRDAGIEFDRYLWNYSIHNEAHGVWTNDDAGRATFVSALCGAVEQGLVPVAELRRIKDLGRLQRAYQRTWSGKGFAALLETALPDRPFEVALRKGSLQTVQGRQEIVLRVANELFPSRSLESLSSPEAALLADAIVARHHGLKIGSVWQLLRVLNTSLPAKKPRKPKSKRLRCEVSEGGARVRAALNDLYGVGWHRDRQTRLAVRRFLLGLDSASRRGAREAVRRLGLHDLEEPFAKRMAQFLVEGAPEAVHELDWGRRSKDDWKLALEDGRGRDYIRWAYETLLGAERPSREGADGYPALRGLGIQYFALDGALWNVVVDMYGEEEAYAVRNLSMPRGTHSGEEGRDSQVQRLRRLVESNVGELNRNSVKDWLRKSEGEHGMKDWLDHYRFVSLLRNHFSSKQVELFVSAFSPEGLKAWDVPAYSFKAASDSDVACILNDYWQLRGLDRSSPLEELGSTLTVGQLQEANLGGLLHRKSPRRKKLMLHLAEVAAPEKDWTQFAFDDQSEYCRLGYEFEDVVTHAFRAGAGQEEYFEQRFVDPGDGGGRVRPDFSMRSQRLVDLFGDFADAKLTSGELANSENVMRLKERHKVTVIYAIKTCTPTTGQLTRISFSELLETLGLKGAIAARLLKLHSRVEAEYRRLKSGK